MNCRRAVVYLDAVPEAEADARNEDCGGVLGLERKGVKRESEGDSEGEGREGKHVE